MRLWYQSFARLDEFDTYGTSLRTLVQAAADESSVVDVYGIERGGGIADQFRYLEYLDTGEVIQNALRAEREGYNAFLIGNIADPGLFEARELVNIPVLGLCESSLHIACMVGRRYGMIIINHKFGPRILEQVHKCGLTSQYVGSSAMDVPKLSDLGGGFVAGEAKEQLLAKFRSSGRTCIELGAEILVPAGGVVMAMLMSSGVRDIDGVPVLDGVSTLVKMGEVAVKLQSIFGTFTSRAASYAKPSGEVLAQIRSFHGDTLYT